MSIFNFTDEQSLGEVRSVETSRITVRVTDGQRLQKARVGRLVAIQSMGDEWLIGIIERVWRHPVELPTLPEVDPPADLAGVPQEENGVSISLVGTYRARDGQRKDTFTRAVFILPEINRPVFPIEEKSLEDFMGILSASSKADAAAPLKVGTYTLMARPVPTSMATSFSSAMPRCWAARARENLSPSPPSLSSPHNCLKRISSCSICMASIRA